MDTLKLRMQIHTGQASGVFQVARGLIASHGVSALWSGLVPGCQRQILFGGIRMGAYDIIKANVSSALGEREGSSSLAVKLLSGVLSGSLAAAIASPTDLVKVRMQAQSGVAATPGHTPYANWLDCYRRVLREEGGVRALWRGCGPNIARNACVNMVELATVSPPPPHLHVTASMLWLHTPLPPLALSTVRLGQGSVQQQLRHGRLAPARRQRPDDGPGRHPLRLPH